MADQATKPYDNSDYNRFYTDGDSCDQDIFAEQRSNLLLVAGDHYNKRRINLFRRLRDSKELSQEQKLRLTKNHIQRICKTYVNNILSLSPGVGFTPKNESELQDQKAAELHHAVWQDAKERYHLDDKIDDWCDSFVNIGEVAVKIFYDPNGGDIIGHTQMVDDGVPVFDEQGNPEPDPSQPVFQGEFVFEEIYGFNLLRPSECKELHNAEWLCIRKMVAVDVLKARYAGDEEKLKFIVASDDKTFLVYDSQKAGYRRTDKEVLIREFFFKPCARYPKGWHCVSTQEGILEEGELPGGIFPIVFRAFDKVATTPRGRSPIKTMRPYQVEINRAASKMAEHQITLGDDKLIIQNGSKVSPGVALPGVRSINVTGANPVVMPGRDGSQYLQYMQAQIAEMYDVMNVAEDSKEITGQVDPYVLLFRSATQKKKFQRYIRRFEAFLVDVVKTYLSLAKIHLPENALIRAIGRDEIINIPEFKNSHDLGYEIKVEGQADDIETKMGKQLVLNHALQYVGSQLKPEDIGKFMREMPYANFEGAFDDMTIDFDAAENDILSLDRGEMPPINQYDNHVYMLKRLTARMRKADFKFLPPPVQQNYQNKVAMHQQFQAMQQIQIQRMESGYIPTGGYMVVCDLYTTDPTDPNKTRRARVPYEALQWLIQHLEAQGQSLDQLEDLNQGSQVQIGQQMQTLRAGLGQAQPQQPGMPPNGMGAPGMMGKEMPQGAINGSARQLRSRGARF